MDAGLRRIPGYDDYYVSDAGQIFTLWAGRILKLVDQAGKYSVRIRKNGDRYHKLAVVGRLVLEAFVGPCPEGMVCRRLDGDTYNDTLSNLYWGKSHPYPRQQITWRVRKVLK